jgi:hypothetical protein
MSASAPSTRRVRLDLESLCDRALPSTTHLFAVGQDIGGSSIVKVYNADGSPNRDIDAFASDFTGGARVAVGDVTGDGTDDIVVAAGPGGAPEVKVYDGANGNLVRDIIAYDPSFHGGVNIAVGDVSGDGKADIITGTGVDGGPNVRVFDGATGNQIDSFFAYEPSFRGGVNVAAGDVNADGHADIVTGTGVGGGPRVQTFDGVTGAELSNFFAYDPSVRGGVTVAAGDLSGSGHADIVTGDGPGGGPNVRVFDGESTELLNSYYAYNPDFLGGISVEVANGYGSGDVLVAPGPSDSGTVEIFDGATADAVFEFVPFPGFLGGITTGQGVATLAAPYSTAVATPVPLANSGQSGGGAPADNGEVSSATPGPVCLPGLGSPVCPTPIQPPANCPTGSGTCDTGNSGSTEDTSTVASCDDNGDTTTDTGTSFCSVDVETDTSTDSGSNCTTDNSAGADSGSDTTTDTGSDNTTESGCNTADSTGTDSGAVPPVDTGNTDSGTCPTTDPGNADPGPTPPADTGSTDVGSDPSSDPGPTPPADTGTDPTTDPENTNSDPTPPADAGSNDTGSGTTIDPGPADSGTAPGTTDSGPAAGGDSGTDTSTDLGSGDSGSVDSGNNGSSDYGAECRTVVHVAAPALNPNVTIHQPGVTHVAVKR